MVLQYESDVICKQVGNHSVTSVMNLKAKLPTSLVYKVPINYLVKFLLQSNVWLSCLVYSISSSYDAI